MKKFDHRYLRALNAGSNLDAMVVIQKHRPTQGAELTPLIAVGFLEVDEGTTGGRTVHGHLDIAQGGGQDRVHTDQTCMIDLQSEGIEFVAVVLVLAEGEVHAASVDADRAVRITHAKVGIAYADKGIEVGAGKVEGVKVVRRQGSTNTGATKLDVVFAAKTEGEITAKVNKTVDGKLGTAQINLQGFATATVNIQYQFTVTTGAGTDTPYISAQPERDGQRLGAVINGATVARGVDDKLGLINRQIEHRNADQPDEVAAAFGAHPHVTTQTQNQRGSKVQVVYRKANATGIAVPNTGEDVLPCRAEGEIHHIFQLAITEHDCFKLQLDIKEFAELRNAEQINIEQAIELEQTAELGKRPEVKGDIEVREVQVVQQRQEIGQ